MAPAHPSLPPLPRPPPPARPRRRARHAACSYGNVETAAWLLQNGGDVGLRDSDGDTPLMVCESAACAALLKGAGADVFAANTAGRTAFHTATLEYREEMVAWLTAEYAAAGVALPAVERDEDDEEDEDGGGDFGDDGEGEDEGEGEGEGGDVAAAPAAAAEPPA